MNDPLPDFRAVIKLWPSRPALARDLGLPRITVEAWYRINSIPPRWFDAIERAAVKADYEGVTKELLLELHERRVEEGPPPKKAEMQEADA